ncbi:MAG TPA: NAD(P)/FAD-dependent oxidoreductase [Alphaproteobacteria bacterium]|nr:NAD(P)/FAD-dependent oxidoreductase [Alphaproteobacteria bacterium]
MSAVKSFDALVIGGGAAGLFCAGRAGQRGLKVALIEHTAKLGEKIRISGGGRSNFTNLYSSPANFLSTNPHFCKSALARFTPRDFLTLVESYKIGWHEKSQHPNVKGQLFCDDSAQNIIDMLVAECEKGGVTLSREVAIAAVSKTEGGFRLETNKGVYETRALVVATGGLSIPKIGAGPFGYNLARQFGLKVVLTRPALVPLTFSGALLDEMRSISGLSLDAVVSAGGAQFQEGMLFTHRGLSGPSILQISSYWTEGDALSLDTMPGQNALAQLKTIREKSPRVQVHTALSQLVPARLADLLARHSGVTGMMADLSNDKLERLAVALQNWSITPAATEGYRTAEVTLGGVDTDEISSKTFEAKKVPGLYFIGEVLDVTGHLGGHNFQWAWSSAAACAESL